MKAKANVPDTDEKREKMSELHDALSRAYAIITGATAIGAMASVSGRGVELLRRLVLEAEAPLREARELAEELRHG
jgi:hypothetical protein